MYYNWLWAGNYPKHLTVRPVSVMTFTQYTKNFCQASCAFNHDLSQRPGPAGPKSSTSCQPARCHTSSAHLPLKDKKGQKYIGPCSCYYQCENPPGQGHIPSSVQADFWLPTQPVTGSRPPSLEGAPVVPARRGHHMSDEQETFAVSVGKIQPRTMRKLSCPVPYCALRSSSTRKGQGNGSATTFSHRSVGTVRHGIRLPFSVEGTGSRYSAILPVWAVPTAGKAYTQNTAASDICSPLLLMGRMSPARNRRRPRHRYVCANITCCQNTTSSWSPAAAV